VSEPTPPPENTELPEESTSLLGKIKARDVLLVLLLVAMFVVAGIKIFGSTVSKKFEDANSAVACLSMFYNELPTEPEVLEEIDAPEVGQPDDPTQAERGRLLDAFQETLPEDVLARLRQEFDA